MQRATLAIAGLLIGCTLLAVAADLSSYDPVRADLMVGHELQGPIPEIR